MFAGEPARRAAAADLGLSAQGQLQVLSLVSCERRVAVWTVVSRHSALRLSSDLIGHSAPGGGLRRPRIGANTSIILPDTPCQLESSLESSLPHLGSAPELRTKRTQTRADGLAAGRSDEADPKAGLMRVEPSDGTASEASSGNPMSPFDMLCR